MPSPQANVLSVCLCAILCLSCDHRRPDFTGPGRVASLVLRPFTASLEPGQTLRLTPVIRYSDGTFLTAQRVTWTTSDPEVASVTAAGRVTAVRPGSARVTAVADGESAAATIIVLASATVVEITPDSPTIATGTSVQLMATVLGPGGTRVTGRVVSWSTSNPEIATVSVGKVRGRRPGSARIEATAGDARGETEVTVLPATDAPMD
ncbi:MAG TPA: Ig-like domain-containing protein [Gemmatimonadales bacterium]|nr:Ig-like domain-containing protein [Gemmatimonadales bacterium]